MNIIPTPQYIKIFHSHSEISCDEILKFTYCDDDLKETISVTRAFLDDFSFVSQDLAKLIITTDKKIADSVSAVDYDWFKNKNAHKQGYIIKGLTDGRVLIYAESRQGILYALATLSQIEDVESEFEIKDYPDFLYRGNKWLIWAETEIWSHDLGDGTEALKERIIRKLDVCLQYKINFLIFDAWGFDAQRYDGYADLMSFFNKAARMRGIHLSTGGYTMGYGMSQHQFGKHMSKVYKNRTSYPDGDEYECLGTFFHDEFRNNGKPFVVAREFGTCLSNDSLTELKLEELREYIKKTQPGAIYLHNMDSYLIDPMFWQARCDECRKKWPNDDLYASDGMAGAFAYFFDKLNEGLKGICVEDYDSSRDLLIINISPGYMWYHIDDYEVEKAVKFWKAVSDYSKVKENVFPGVRELFYNLKNNQKRISDIVAPALGGRVAVINFSGGDGYHTDKLFFVSSVFNSFFKGSDVVITCSGHYFQEPLQVFNAEYMWNCEGSAFYRPENIPDNYDDFMKLYLECQKTSFRPKEVYGNGGMLDIICQKLYGKDAPAASEMFKLCGTNYECPVPYTCNKEILTAGNDVVLAYRWDALLKREEIESYLSSFEQMKDVTHKACDILKECTDVDLKAYHKMLLLTLPIVELWHSYLDLYSEVSREFENSRVPDFAYVKKIQDLIDKVDYKHTQHLNMNFASTDIMLGALAKREDMFVLMKTNLQLMKKSVESGKRIPEGAGNHKAEVWW